MRKVEPLKWSEINGQLNGKHINNAVADLGRMLTDKVNEMVESFNTHVDFANTYNGVIENYNDVQTTPSPKKRRLAFPTKKTKVPEKETL
jgi:hypothetical protein